MSTNFGANKFNLANETKHTQSKISHINVFAQQNKREKSKAKLIQLALTAPTHNKEEDRKRGEGRELAKAMPCCTYLIYNANSNSRKKAARLPARSALIICPQSEEERERMRRRSRRSGGAAHKSRIRREQVEKMLQQLLVKCVKRRRRWQGRMNKKAGRNKGIKSNEQKEGEGAEGQKRGKQK